jgi:ArsR family transcriptional regulator
MEDKQQLYNIAANLEALGNETRLEVFQLLVQAGHTGMAVGQLQKHLDIPGSTLSHHIARLVSVGLVQQERISRSLICRANFNAMNSVIAFLTKNCCELDPPNQDKNHE